MEAMPVCAIASQTLSGTLVQFQCCIGLAEPHAYTVCKGRGIFFTLSVQFTFSKLGMQAGHEE